MLSFRFEWKSMEWIRWKFLALIVAVDIIIILKFTHVSDSTRRGNKPKSKSLNICWRWLWTFLCRTRTTIVERIEKLRSRQETFCEYQFEWEKLGKFRDLNNFNKEQRQDSKILKVELIFMAGPRILNFDNSSPLYPRCYRSYLFFLPLFCCRGVVGECLKHFHGKLKMRENLLARII